jgi:hypothetical protein
MTSHLLPTACRTMITAVCLCLTTTALADRAASDELPAAAPPPRSEPVALRIVEDGGSATHRIVIPKAVLAKIAGGVPSADPIVSATPARSIVAALALSAAVACGLVAFRRGRPGRVAMLVVGGLSLAAVAALLGGGPALADLAAPDGSPRRPRPRPAVHVPESVTLAQGGKVVLEIGEAGGDAVILVVGTEAADKDQQEPPREPRGSVAPPPG